jgi:hypothetical protein
MTKQIWQVAFILLASVSIGIALGQGCAKPFTQQTAASTADPTNLVASENTELIDPNSQTLSMVYSKQVLDHMVSCSGVGIPSDATMATWATKKGAVSIDGSILTITAPMLMAVTTIAGDVCRDLINQEKTAPRIFNGVNWSGTALPADGVLNDSIRGLALSCWPRMEEDAERQIIMDAVKSEFGSGSINMSEAYLFLCTSMLSSLETLTM